MSAAQTYCDFAKGFSCYFMSLDNSNDGYLSSFSKPAHECSTGGCNKVVHNLCFSFRYNEQPWYDEEVFFCENHASTQNKGLSKKLADSFSIPTPKELMNKYLTWIEKNPSKYFNCTCAVVYKLVTLCVFIAHAMYEEAVAFGKQYLTKKSYKAKFEKCLEENQKLIHAAAPGDDDFAYTEIDNDLLKSIDDLSQGALETLKASAKPTSDETGTEWLTALQTPTASTSTDVSETAATAAPNSSASTLVPSTSEVITSPSSAASTETAATAAPNSGSPAPDVSETGTELLTALQTPSLVPSTSAATTSPSSAANSVTAATAAPNSAASSAAGTSLRPAATNSESAATAALSALSDASQTTASPAALPSSPNSSVASSNVVKGAAILGQITEAPEDRGSLMNDARAYGFKSHLGKGRASSNFSDNEENDTPGETVASDDKSEDEASRSVLSVSNMTNKFNEDDENREEGLTSRRFKLPENGPPDANIVKRCISAACRSCISTQQVKWSKKDEFNNQCSVNWGTGPGCITKTYTFSQAVAHDFFELFIDDSEADYATSLKTVKHFRGIWYNNTLWGSSETGEYSDSFVLRIPFFYCSFL